MSARRAFLALLVSLPAALAAASSGHTADANFYSLQEQWNKQSRAPKEGRQDALDDAFSDAFRTRASQRPGAVSPNPPTIYLTPAQIASRGAVTELELGQILIIEPIQGLVKFVTAEEGIVTIENADGQSLRVIGSSIGSTFVHWWDAAGRTTFSVKVLPPKPILTLAQTQRLQEIDKSRPFRLSFNNALASDHTGDKFRQMDRRSLDYNQGFSLSGDTPHGALSARVQTQKDRGKTQLTDAQMKLADGKIGPFKNFDATAGDVRVDSGLMVFPSARLRGGELKTWNDDKDERWSVFSGRESSSQFGTIISSLATKRTRTSFLSGAVTERSFDSGAKWKAGVFDGYGRSRADELNRTGMGVQSEVPLGEKVSFRGETDFDDEKFAHRHAVTAQFENLRIRSEFRDISKKFYTLLGASSQQGEVGVLFDGNAVLNDDWSLEGKYDLFRDRLIPNPESPGRYNQHTDLTLNYAPFNDMNFAFDYQDQDDTGRLSPARYRNMGAQMNTWFDLWGRRYTFFTRYNHRANHFLTQSLRDLRQDQLTLGFNTALFWGIHFSAQREWSLLEDVELGEISHPSALTLTWDASRQLGASPFYLDARVRLRDEEETESLNSFMAGEDSAEVSGGLTYRESEDLEIFLTGSLTQYVPENRSVLSPRVEAQFFTGMRSTFDTGFRWRTVGNFEGYVFKDLNGDGLRDDGEPPLEGLTVVSSDGQRALSDAEGRYRLEKVAGKKASLTLDDASIPTGFVLSGSANREFTIQQGQTYRADFGLTARSDISGVVFDDLNSNGAYDPGESVVAGVRLILDDGRVSVTNSYGMYSFNGTSVGAHSVQLAVTALPEGYLPASSPKQEIRLGEGQRFDLRFPLHSKRTVSGRVFVDDDENGRLDASEAVLPGIMVDLGDRTISTDKGGWYLFDDLMPGTYDLVIDAKQLVSGFEAPPKETIQLPVGPFTAADRDLPVKKRALSTTSVDSL